jgi:hypothetical protein
VDFLLCRGAWHFAVVDGVKRWVLIGSKEIADRAEFAFALAFTFQIEVEGFEMLYQR